MNTVSTLRAGIATALLTTTGVAWAQGVRELSISLASLEIAFIKLSGAPIPQLDGLDPAAILAP